jgi:diacylglycerol kinase family enzyme
MKIFFLLNPSRVKNRWDWRTVAARHAKKAGWTPRFGEVDRTLPHSTARLLDQAVEEGCSRIVVAGGDGTLHRTINLLAQKRCLQSVEVAVIPAGTCNDFARILGIRRQRIENAFRLACTGKPQPTDLGMMDNELFINNAGFGRRPAPAGKRWKSWQALRAFRPTAIRARWDKGSIEGAFFMVLVCNAPYFSGGLHFSKKVNVRDGLLDVYLMPAIPKWRLVPLLALGRLGRPTRFKQLIALRVSSLELKTGSDVWPQADGEPPAQAVRQVNFSVSTEKAMIVAP